MDIEIRIEGISPIHLGSGREDVNIDAEIVHDACGLPYFPAKRFKGLLYESALEVSEMSELSGCGLLSGETLKELFHHDDTKSDAQLVISDFHMETKEGYKKISEELKALEENYPEFLKPSDVLDVYTSVRYQTELENGVAKKGSLHNMRVVDAGVVFCGTIRLLHGTEQHLRALAFALRNLKAAGLKRSRGFGRIACSMRLEDGRTEKDLIAAALKEAV